jgi:hypothetical protein
VQMYPVVSMVTSEQRKKRGREWCCGTLRVSWRLADLASCQNSGNEPRNWIRWAWAEFELSIEGTRSRTICTVRCIVTLWTEGAWESVLAFALLSSRWWQCNLTPYDPVQLRRRFGGVESTVVRNSGELLLDYSALRSNDLAFLKWCTCKHVFNNFASKLPWKVQKIQRSVNYLWAAFHDCGTYGYVEKSINITRMEVTISP